MNQLALLALLAQCSPDIPPQNLVAIVNVESGFNQYAVAVVQQNGDADYISYSQPSTLEEANKLIDILDSKNKNYSVGLMQINKLNFNQYSIDKSNMFDACKNIKVGGDIYKKCYLLAKNSPENENKTEQELLRMANSCYYSGNLTRGFKKENNNFSYVDKINKSIKDVDSIYSVPTLKIEEKGNEELDESNSSTKVTSSSYDWDVFNDFKR